MVKTGWLIGLLCLINSAFAQVLFTYGNNAVTKQEFLRAFNKNKPATADKGQAMKEYLQLFINFKMKVQAAKELHLDTLSSLKADQENFASQIKESYMVDEAEVNRLVKEAYNRGKRDIEISYLFIPAIGDSARLKDMATGAAASLNGKKETVDQLVARLKRDNLEPTFTKAGYVTAFTLPYEIENIVYNLRTGEFSKPYKTEKGYYIFTKDGERPAMGKVAISQILIAVPEKATEQEKNKASQLSDSLYGVVTKGGDFAALARQFSDDRSSATTGGVIEEVTAGKYDRDFEDHVYDLKEGAVARPFRTSYGYHIIKRLHRDAKDSLGEQYDVKQKVLQDERMDGARSKFMEKVLKVTGYKWNTLVPQKTVWALTDSSLASNHSIKKTTTLFTVGNKKATVGDWLEYKAAYRPSPTAKPLTGEQLLKQFVDKFAATYYKDNLQTYNSDYSLQMKEFKEGNMLFEVMERNVWNKAAADSVGLRKYYSANKDKYTWNKSATIVTVGCTDQATANHALTLLQDGTPAEEIRKTLGDKAQVDSSRTDYEQLPADKKDQLREGETFITQGNTQDAPTTVQKVVKIFPAGQQKTFEEARGLVISDYQTVLEKSWIESLRKKYPVKVNEAVLKTML